MNDILNKLKNKRILGLIGLVCLFLGIITPYITISIFGLSESLSLWSYWEGKVIFVLTIANLLFIFKDYIEKYVPQVFNSNIGSKIKKANPKMSLVPTVLVVVFTICLNTTIDVDSTFFKHGIGFWLLWIGVAALVGHAVLYKCNGVETQITTTNMSDQNNNGMQYGQNNMNNYNQTNQYVNNQVNNMQNVNQNVYQNQQVEQSINTNNSYVNTGFNNQTQTIKYCQNCGAQMNGNDTICNVCGK